MKGLYRRFLRRPAARRHLTLQCVAIGLAAVAAAPFLPWPAILAWGLVTLLCSAAEERAWRAGQAKRPWARRARVVATLLRFTSSALYAVASAALIIRGQAAAREFAVALIACSMVWVLQRYYRSGVAFLACISPHLAVLSWVGIGLTKLAIGRHDLFGALTPAATVAIFGGLFWAARGQLVDGWQALSRATRQAQDRARAAQSANRAKSDFLATMSHELRTPLNGVIGMAQAMSRDRLPRVQQERLSVIRRSGEGLMSILNDLLDLSRIETEDWPLEAQDFDVEHMVRGVLMVFAHLADRKGVSFEADVAPAARGLYRGDQARLRRILYALMSNAVKFTEAGHVRLSVDAGPEGLVFHVTDTGIGIGADELPHLFDAFYQADASASRRYGGAGLGLAICRQLVGQMGGRLAVDSTPGQGSTFTLTVPLARTDAAPADRAPPVQGIEAASLRILAAEDNEANQLVLRTLLEQVGVDATIVPNGREAVAAWQTGDWDLILMDIQMPEMDGVAATRAIRAAEREAGRPHTPIVALTANAMAHQVEAYQAAGMEAVIAKPIQAPRLFEVLQTVLAADRGGERALHTKSGSRG